MLLSSLLSLDHEPRSTVHDPQLALSVFLFFFFFSSPFLLFFSERLALDLTTHLSSLCLSVSLFSLSFPSLHLICVGSHGACHHSFSLSLSLSFFSFFFFFFFFSTAALKQESGARKLSKGLIFFLNLKITETVTLCGDVAQDGFPLSFTTKEFKFRYSFPLEVCSCAD